MIDLEFVERLIRAMDESGLDSIEIERGGTRIKLNRTPASSPAPPAAQPQAAPAPQPAAPAPARAGASGAGSGGEAASASAADEDGGGSGGDGESDLVEVTSPMVGTFYRAPSPDAPPYVDVGDRVAAGETLCIIEAMKLMNELECETPGSIEEICVEDAEPVEYGQVLFRIKP